MGEPWGPPGVLAAAGDPPPHLVEKPHTVVAQVVGDEVPGDGLCRVGLGLGCPIGTTHTFPTPPVESVDYVRRTACTRSF